MCFLYGISLEIWWGWWLAFSIHVLVFFAAEIHWIVFYGLDGVGLCIGRWSLFQHLVELWFRFLFLIWGLCFYFLQFGYCQSLSRVFFYTIYFTWCKLRVIMLMRCCKKRVLSFINIKFLLGYNFLICAESGIVIYLSYEIQRLRLILNWLPENLI